MPTNTASWVGQLLSGGRYQVTERLGEGGMAIVYRGRDKKLDTDVVIKVPRPALLDDPQFAQRFAREIRALVQLDHPRIVKVRDVGQHDGLPFAVLQYLSGGSLRDRQLAAGRGQPVPMKPEALRIWLAPVAEALDFIHQQGFIHRDVKPDNILFDAHRNVYLSDFGVAKVLADGRPKAQRTVITRIGTLLGTPSYMAPELHLGEDYDARVDQYALAVTVYELLSGRPPFDGTTPAALVVQQSKQPALPLDTLIPSVPRRLAAAVQRAMAREPKDRYPDCGAFARAALEEVFSSPENGLKTKPGPAFPRVPTVLEPVSQPVRDPKTMVEDDAAEIDDVLRDKPDKSVKLADHALLREGIFRRRLETLSRLHRTRSLGTPARLEWFLLGWVSLYLVVMVVVDLGQWATDERPYWFKEYGAVVTCLSAIAVSACVAFGLLPRYVSRRRSQKLAAHIQGIIDEYPDEIGRWGGQSNLNDPVKVEEIIRILRARYGSLGRVRIAQWPIGISG